MKRIAISILTWFLVCTGGILFSACALFWDPKGSNHVVTSQDASKFIGSIRAHRGNADSHYELGCYLQERKRHKPAIEEFRTALEIDPSHVKCYNSIGVSYDALGDYGSAEQSYVAALAIDPKLDYVLNNLGYSYLLQGKPDLAIENFKKALDLDTGNELYRNNLGLAYAKSGQYMAAFAEFKQTGLESKAHYNIAQLYYRGGFYKEAETHFEKASGFKTSDPQTERGLRAAGNLAKIAGKGEEVAGGVAETSLHAEGKQKITAPPSLSRIRILEGTREQTVRIMEAETLQLYDQSQALELASPEFPGTRKGPKSEVKIEVSNGNGVNRMARKVGNYLSGKGFALKYVCNATSFCHEETKIYYVKGYLQEACVLAERLPGWQRLEEVAEIRKGDAEISILIGKDLISHLSFFELS